MDIQGYQLLSAPTSDDLTMLVEEALSDGWQPWQAPGVAHSGTQRLFCQAVVKYAKKTQHLSVPR
jgi:hypothetical protein